MKSRTLGTLACWMVGVSLLFAQGKDNYLNFEAGENEALAIARIPDLMPSGSSTQTFTHYLLVANTVNDSVDVYNALTNAFQTRVATGLSPIGVYIKPTAVTLDATGYLGTLGATSHLWNLAYSVNWIGDSITLIGLRHVGTPGSQSLYATALRTVSVGDEPTAIAIQPHVPGLSFTEPGQPYFESLVVTHGIQGTWDVRDGVTLQTLTSPTGTPWEKLELLEAPPSSSVPAPRAVREAWQVKYRPGASPTSPPQMVVLNRRGGNYSAGLSAPQNNYVQIATNPTYTITSDPDYLNVNKRPEYDFDIWGPVTPGVLLATLTNPVDSIAPRIGRLGSTNFAMAYASNGDLYIVGQVARNNDAAHYPSSPPIIANGEQVTRNMESNDTGFVQSMIWRIPAGWTPGTPPEFLDLNASTSSPVRIAQPTALVIKEESNGNHVIYVTGFNSDTLAQVTVPSGNTLSAASFREIDLRAGYTGATPFPTYIGSELEGQMMGPRSLALLSEPGVAEKLFVLNKIDRSIYVFDPASLPSAVTIAPQISLFDPRPAYIKRGQPLLYSSHLSVQRMSSCASCHIDGHFDGLSWNLSGAPFGTTPLTGAFHNTPNKGPMFTQSLRGLATFEVGGSPVSPNATGTQSNVAQRLFTTEPLHWRGDKGFFEDFNAAFVNLLGMSTASHGSYVQDTDPNADLRKGIPDGNMEDFRDFIFSVAYPPNPDQPILRIYSGVLGSQSPAYMAHPELFHGSTGGSLGAQRGLELFHDSGVAFPGSSCASCHMLPSGTNMIPTEEFGHPLEPNVLLFGNVKVETAALRGLFHKEKRLMRKSVPANPTTTPSVLVDIAPTTNLAEIASFQTVSANLTQEGTVIGEFGLTHTGNNTELLPTAAPRLLAGFASESTKAFVNGFNGLSATQIDELAIFQRELDTGSAPIIGFTILIDRHTLNIPVYGSLWGALVSDLLGQVRLANAGLVCRARIAGVEYGLHFDPVSDSFIEVSARGLPGSTSFPPLGPIDLNSLLNFVSATQTDDDALTFIFVPLGADRRMANLDANGNVPVSDESGKVTGIQLEPMVPNTANKRVPSFPRIIRTGSSFGSLPTIDVNQSTDIGPEPMITSDALAATLALIDSNGPLFGVSPTLNHQPPRRFVVRGTGILHGARMRIYFPTQADADTAVWTGTQWNPPTTQPGTNNHWIEFPIYPRTETDIEPCHESAVELDHVAVHSLLCGGPNSPLVQSFGGLATYNLVRFGPTWGLTNFYNNLFLAGALAAPGIDLGFQAQNYFVSLLPTMQSLLNSAYGPGAWNWYFVEIYNTFSSSSGPQIIKSDGGWQRLTMAP